MPILSKLLSLEYCPDDVRGHWVCRSGSHLQGYDHVLVIPDFDDLVDFWSGVPASKGQDMPSPRYLPDLPTRVGLHSLPFVEVGGMVSLIPRQSY